MKLKILLMLLMMKLSVISYHCKHYRSNSGKGLFVVKINSGEDHLEPESSCKNMDEGITAHQ